MWEAYFSIAPPVLIVGASADWAFQYDDIGLCVILGLIVVNRTHIKVLGLINPAIIGIIVRPPGKQYLRDDSPSFFVVVSLLLMAT